MADTTNTDTTTNTTPLKPAVKNPHNIEATKYYIFNQTGNIMISSTSETNQELSASVQQVFAEVSVFFAGMSRAITTTINPKSGQPYSLYNYQALERIIDGSGLFIHVNEEDVEYSTKSFGADFSKSLIESLLGLATGEGEMAFASAMVSSMGKEGVRINTNSSETHSKVSNIVFVCEHLLGMPIVSAIVVYADATDHERYISAGACFSVKEIDTTWNLHKDTYLFVTPTFIKQYAGDLDSIESDPRYVQLVHWFQGLVMGSPAIDLVRDVETQEIVGNELTSGKPYRFEGKFFPTPKGTLTVGADLADKVDISMAGWSSTEIRFSITLKSDVTSAEAVILTINDSTQKPVVSSSAFKILPADQNIPKAKGDTPNPAGEPKTT